MKATVIGLAAALLAGAAVSSASANPSVLPGQPQAPDACGPGFYAPNCCGQWYGPNYCLRPSYPPFNGLLPGPNGGSGGSNGAGSFGGIPTFPTHPFARGPRDYFMLDP
jgi:hypothetical protein